MIRSHVVQDPFEWHVVFAWTPVLIQELVAVNSAAETAVTTTESETAEAQGPESEFDPEQHLEPPAKKLPQRKHLVEVVVFLDYYERRLEANSMTHTLKWVNRLLTSGAVIPEPSKLETAARLLDNKTSGIRDHVFRKLGI